MAALGFGEGAIVTTDVLVDDDDDGAGETAPLCVEMAVNLPPDGWDFAVWSLL